MTGNAVARRSGVEGVGAVRGTGGEVIEEEGAKEEEGVKESLREDGGEKEEGGSIEEGTGRGAEVEEVAAEDFRFSLLSFFPEESVSEPEEEGEEEEEEKESSSK
jgi:hypothetical protein